MSKRHKKLTRAMKIELAKQEAAAQRALEAENKRVPSVDEVVELVKEIERHKGIRNSCEECECEHDCNCVRNGFNASEKIRRLEKKMDRIEAAFPEVIKAAQAALEQELIDAKIRFDETNAAMCQPTVEGDLLEVLEHGGRKISYVNYCHSIHYDKWEHEVAEPILLELGYKHVSFLDIERDSFGPLIRTAVAVKDGRYHSLQYG